MRDRCALSTHPKFRDYGARGITVCDRWRDFEAYVQDIEALPRSPDTTLDRVDNDGPYEPGNMRWATAQEQNLNKRKYRTSRPRTAPPSHTLTKIIHEGRALTTKEAAALRGCGAHTLKAWLRDKRRLDPTLTEIPLEKVLKDKK